MQKKLDKYDKRILKIMQEDADISNKELLERIGLAPSSTLLRIKSLKENKIIKKTVVLLDKDRLDYTIITLTKVTLTSLNNETINKFKDCVHVIPEIKECFTISKSASYMLKVVAKDQEYYRKNIVNKIAEIANISSIETTIVLEIEKNTTAIPLK